MKTHGRGITKVNNKPLRSFLSVHLWDESIEKKTANPVQETEERLMAAAQTIVTRECWQSVGIFVDIEIQSYEERKKRNKEE
jgi:hypothetical protein